MQSAGRAAVERHSATHRIRRVDVPPPGATPDFSASDIGNGPPGTFVLFPNGLSVSLPTDQIVFADDTRGHARVGFGGMRFVGSEEGRLVFVRIRELFPTDQLSPARSHKMLLDPQWVATISVDGQHVWPREREGS